MNNINKSVLCLLTAFSVSSSGFCSGSNNFGIGLLLGTAKSKISSEYINKLNKYLHNAFIQGAYSESQDYEKYFTIKNNPVSEKSDFRFDTGIIAFYQYNFNDTFFTRIGAFGNFTVANNKFSVFNLTVSSTKLQDLNLDCNLKHSFDLGGQLLVGFNLAKQFSIVIGGELGYTKGQLDLNVTDNNKKILDNKTLYSFGSLFYGIVGGVEFNFKNVVIGVHGFLHSIKLNDSDFKFKDENGNTTKTNENKKNKDTNPLKLKNVGVRLMIAYKF